MATSSGSASVNPRGRCLAGPAIELVKPHPITAEPAVGIEAGEMHRQVKEPGECPQLDDLGHVENQAAGIDGFRLHIEGDRADARNPQQVIGPFDFPTQPRSSVHPT